MAKSFALSALLLVQIVCATFSAAAAAAADQGTAELAAACNKTADAKFCINLLQPHVAEFVGNDPHKIAAAAITAAAAKAEEAQNFLVAGMIRSEFDAELPLLHKCQDLTDPGVEAVGQAGALYKANAAGANATVVSIINEKINLFVKGQDECCRLMKGGGVGDDAKVVTYVCNAVNVAAAAGRVAQAFLD